MQHLRGRGAALVLAGAGGLIGGRRNRHSYCGASSKDGLLALDEPRALWHHFASISAIPRASKQEQRVLQYVKDFANEKGFRWQQDQYGNLLVCRPGTGGGEHAETVMLQGHVDMVCEKNKASSHDFCVDPIQLRVEGDWLRAADTTLGADNGIGVAATLAVLEMGPEAKLPPIEALFTVEEEIGLKGASGLDGGMVTAKKLLNLDTEEFPNLYIGCAGGGGATLDVRASPMHLPGGTTNLCVEVTGLLGGHSGINIHECRGNAVLMAAALAADVLARVPEARLVSITGGDKHNAIPREARAVLAVPSEGASQAAEAVSRRAAVLRAEFGLLEKGLVVATTPSEATPSKAFSAADSARLLAALRSLPHGVQKMSHAIEGLVETSNNVAAAHTSGDGLHILMSQRSSIGGAVEAVQDRLEAIAALSGGTLKRGSSYPGWAPDPKAPLVSLATEKLGVRSQRKPEVLAVHAGLECGVLLEKCPSINQAVSFGPTIVGAHSPDEALELSTVRPFYNALLDILTELAMTPSRL